MRRAHLAGALLALWLLAVEPAAAQSVNRELLRNLNQKLIYFASPFVIVLEFILVYSVYRYRNNPDPEPTEENRRLEITWTVATAIILVLVGVTSTVVLLNPYISPVAGQSQYEANVSNPYLQGAVQPDDPNAVEVNVLAFQWGWEFTYREANVTTREQVVIPANRNVYLHVTSRDVIHAFYAPKLGLKQDAIPGQYNTIRTRVTEPGTYQFYCAEFCGTGHSRMLGEVRVLEQAQYEQWVATQQRQENASSASASVSNPAAVGHSEVGMGA